jgi:hypothetical protein
MVRIMKLNEQMINELVEVVKDVYGSPENPANQLRKKLAAKEFSSNSPFEAGKPTEEELEAVRKHNMKTTPIKSPYDSDKGQVQMPATNVTLDE